MRVLFASGVALLAAVVLAPAAGAVPIVVTDGTNLVNADTNHLDMPSAPVAVTGMQPGEKLVGIDQRPTTGELFGVGDSNRVYVLDPATGAATAVGSPFTPALDGTFFGTDFNPVVDRIRQVSNDEQNVRLNPSTGANTAVDSALTPMGSNVVAAAYNNNVSGAANTTLFDIDSASGTLLMQGSAGGTPQSANGGQLNTVGALGPMVGPTPLDENIGFDIGADGVAFATITKAGVSGLYGINTSMGTATNTGTIGTGATPYLGLAIMSARIRLTGDVTGSEGGMALFEVTRSAPAVGPASVDYSTTAGTATSGDDFTPASGTLIWGAGQSGPKTIAVPLTSDGASEGDESFTLSISNVTGTDAALGAPTTATATIAADTTLAFTAASASVVEGDNATLEVARTGSIDRAVSVDYATTSGSADEEDYIPASGTLSWAAGDGAAKTITVPITNDASEEGPESFSVALSNPAGAGAVVGTPGSETVTISASDGKAPRLKLSAKKKQKLRKVRRRGIAVTVRTNEGCKLDASAKLSKKKAKRDKLKRRIAHKKSRLDLSKGTFKLKLTSKAKHRVKAGTKVTVSASCTDDAGNTGKAKPLKVTLKRR